LANAVASAPATFGERRLEAARILNWKKIEARIIDIPRIVEGEYAENEMRKDFTKRERIAIGKAVEGELGERRGKDNRQNVDELKGERSDDVAAKKAGFGNRSTHRAAKKVVEKAAEEVVAEMDAGKLSVSAAAVIADQPEGEQRRVDKWAEDNHGPACRG